MKIVLLALLGLFLGAIGGAALGVGVGLARVEIFKTSDFEGYSGMLVFLGFILQGVPAAERKRFLAEMPLPARLAWRLIGKRTYAKEYREIYGTDPDWRGSTH